MSVVDAGIDHRDDDVRVTGRNVPCLRRIDIIVDHAAVLTDVVQAPLVREARIIWDRRDSKHVIRLRVFDVRICGVSSDGFLYVDAWSELQVPQARYGCKGSHGLE